MKKHSFLIGFLLLNFNLYCLSQNGTGNNNCTEAACHGNVIKYEGLHSAVAQGCDKCHQTNGNAHPSAGVIGFAFPEEIPQLCQKCHQDKKELLKSESVHNPFKKNCIRCHNPHGSNEEHLLHSSPPDLCYKCHDYIQEVVETSKMTHQAVLIKKKCINCHSPHASSQDKNLLQEEKSLCLSCHDRTYPKETGDILNIKQIIENSRVKHGAIEKNGCTACHDPHGSDNAKLLIKEIPKLCLKCHKDKKLLMKLENVHPPFKKNCIRCHSPHGSNEDNILIASPPGLCYKCHDYIQEVVETSKMTHQAVLIKKKCINCHSPHASSEDKNLLLKEKDLCLSCHDRTYPKESGDIINIKKLLINKEFTHGAIVQKGCTACHDPHGSDNAHLLIKAFPEGNYAQGTYKSFKLCFKCHNKEKINVAETDTLTGFRNGTKNLHFVHVNKDKGRSCINCHNVHAADNKHMITDRTTFGNWKMPLNYTVLDNGGSCRPGCHTEKTYTR